jgi:hypothetical protein
MPPFRSATAESAASVGSVVLRSKPASRSSGGYADFLGKLGSGATTKDPVAEEDDEEDELDDAAASAQRVKATREHAIRVRRAWVERMEAEAEADESAPQAPPSGSASADFVPAATFAGPRAGFAFKSGPKGTGYYADASTGKGAARALAFDAGDVEIDISDVGSAMPSGRAAVDSLADAEAAWAAAPVFGDAEVDAAPAAPAAPVAPSKPAVPSPPDARSAAAPRAPTRQLAKPAPTRQQATPAPPPPLPAKAVQKPPEPELLAKALPAAARSPPSSPPREGKASVEFGSMQVADEEEESEEESDDAPAPPTPPSPEAPPAADGGSRTAASRGTCGGDDSDGEIEYG